jgi:hypothetical protein
VVRISTGYIERAPTALEQRIQSAIAAENWQLASVLAARLAAKKNQKQGNSAV